VSFTPVLINGIISAILVLAWTFKQVGFSFNKELLWKMLKFGLPLVPGSLALFVLNNGDRFFLQKYATADILGKYALGYKIGGIIAIMILGPFNKVWSVYVFKISKRDDYGLIYPKVFKFLMLGYALLGLGLAIFAKELITLIAEPEYLQAYTIVPLIIMAYLIWTASTYFDLAFYIMNKTIYKPFLMGFGAAIILIFYWILIPKYNMYGAAIATVIGFGFFTIATYFVANKVYPLRYEFFRLFYMITVAAGIYLFSTIIKLEPKWLEIILKALIWVAFIPILYMLSYFSKAEVAMVKDLIKASYRKLSFAKNN